jgi:hypothetical protein
MIPIAEFRVPYTRFLDAHGHPATTSDQQEFFRRTQNSIRNWFI